MKRGENEETRRETRTYEYSYVCTYVQYRHPSSPPPPASIISTSSTSSSRSAFLSSAPSHNPSGCTSRGSGAAPDSDLPPFVPSAGQEVALNGPISGCFLGSFIFISSSLILPWGTRLPGPSPGPGPGPGPGTSIISAPPYPYCIWRYSEGEGDKKPKFKIQKTKVKRRRLKKKASSQKRRRGRSDRSSTVPSSEPRCHSPTVPPVEGVEKI